MNILFDFKKYYNDFKKYYKTYPDLWLGSHISVLDAYFFSNFFLNQDDLKREWGYVPCYLNKYNVYEHMQETDAKDLKYQIEQMESIICKVQDLNWSEYNKLHQVVFKKKPEYIFIGHGHNLAWARLALLLSDELRLDITYYESDCHTGDSIDKVLDSFIEKVSLAVLVFTAEDETKDGVKRARQNVIHEAGIFRSKLSSEQTIILRQKGVEIPSNLAGIEYIEFEEDKIDQTFYQLQRVLKREGYIKII